MPSRILLGSLAAMVLVGAGCASSLSPEAQDPLPVSVQELQEQAVPVVDKQPKAQANTPPSPVPVGTTLYHGSWFSLAYPASFTARPLTPTQRVGATSRVTTDEAFFTSPDQRVEFFVYSPLWGGDPASYLEIAPTEVLVDERIQEQGEGEVPGTIGSTATRWVTVRAQDGSYMRSFVSLKKQINTGSDVHHVFGIRYRHDAAYQDYKAAYVAFKASLQQYTD